MAKSMTMTRSVQASVNRTKEECMSHFTKVKTKINDLGALCQALDRLGYKYAVAAAGKTVPVRGYMGAKIDAKMSIHTPGGKYDIGVVVDADGGELVADWYEMVADWWGVETTTGKTEAETVEEICRNYALGKVTSVCAAEGYAIESQETDAAGNIQVVAARWN